MLLGSGMSSAAQVPTGWGVVLDLIGKVAALKGGDDARDAAADPEGWWARQGYGDLRYDTLLEAVAPSVSARRDLLHSYFEPADDEERGRGAKLPTAAHRAIAELVGAGRIRLILTTNFDHLVEDALTAAGVPPQVISRADAIGGMAPLQHARATVIKLHGDYLDVEAMRNTPAELERYDPAMESLLARVLDEYGLIILGWSGEWDTALARAIENCSSRRYPTYWAAYQGRISPTGSGLLAGRAGHLITIPDADSFCVDLRDKVAALARMADPPPTRAVAVATLKRNLRPERRIEFFDQLNLATTRTVDRLTDDRYPVKIGAVSSAPNDQVAAELERQLSDYDSDTDVLTALVATATFHGGTDVDALVLRVVRCLCERQVLVGVYLPSLANARRYPVLRVVTAIGVAAVAARREALLVPLLLDISAYDRETSKDAPLVWWLHPWRVIERPIAKLMPRYQPNSVPKIPESSYLRASCRVAFADIADNREYESAFDRYEVLRGMLEIYHTAGGRAALGEFIFRAGSSSSIPLVDDIDDQWPLVVAGGFNGESAKARDVLATLLQQLSQTMFL
jgi:hypothetical protein